MCALLCRILGCITRKEGVLLREAYDNGRYGRTLDTALKSALKKGNFLKACQNVISGDKNLVGDVSKFPLGSDREESEDQEIISRDGERAMVTAAQNYSESKAKALGHPVTDEFEMPQWDVSAKILGLNIHDLSDKHAEFIRAKEDVKHFREAVADDIMAKKDTYYAMMRLCYETESWIRVLNGHVTSLTKFIAKRGK